MAGGAGASRDRQHSPRPRAEAAVRVVTDAGCFILKGRRRRCCLWSKGPACGPARVSPGGEGAGRRDASAQEASAEMLEPATPGILPPGSTDSLESGWLGALPRPPSTQRVSVQVGSSCPFCLPSLVPGSSDGQDAVSVSSLEQGWLVPLPSSHRDFKAGNLIISLN